jgi:acyl-coenzyme A thioesterase PaaI-like protein
MSLLLPYTRNCFVCGAHNAQGLQLKFRREGDEVRADFTPQPHHAGFRAIIHGGILSTVLDEAMFWAAAVATGRFGLAVELNVRFVKKVSVGERLTVVAVFVADKGRLWESRAKLCRADGTVAARATCKQMPMSADEMQFAAGDFLADPATMAAAGLFGSLEPGSNTRPAAAG